MKKIIAFIMALLFGIVTLTGCMSREVKVDFKSEDVLSEGIMNINGKIYDANFEAIVKSYGHIGSYSEGLASVQFTFFLQDKVIYIDEKGNKAIGVIDVSPVEAFQEGMSMISRPNIFGDRQYGYIDKKGNMVVEPQYTWGRSFQEGLAYVEIGEEAFFINQQGEKVIFEDGYNLGGESFSSGLTTIEKNGRWGFINQQGEIVIEPQYEEAYGFSEGLAGIKLNDSWGFIDPSGEIVVTPQYDWLHPFSEGLAMVEKNNKVGFIDQNGNVAIDFKFTGGYSFENGFAIVSDSSKYNGELEGVIDHTGNYIIEPQYYYIDLVVADKGYIIARDQNSNNEAELIVRLEDNKVIEPLNGRDDVIPVSLDK